MTSIFVCHVKSLVHPVPYISTLQIGIFVDSFPLIPKTTGRVSHGMGIFRWYYRTVATVFADVFQPSCTRILWHVHVRVPFPLCTLVVYGAVHYVLVRFFHPKISLIEVITITGFITQWPECKRRIVLVAFKHVCGAINVRLQPFRIISQRSTFT